MISSFCTDLVVSAFLREARSYGRSWSEYHLGGFEVFDGMQTVTGDSGLITLAHELGRTVHHDGARVLISRAWIGGQVRGDQSKTVGKKRSRHASVEPFAIEFVRSLEWSPALQGLINRKNGSTSTRSNISAFMHLVLFGLYCRLRHLHQLIERKDVETFRRVLYAGCSGDYDLIEHENAFLSDAGSCTVLQAKQIVAFWQGGVCGLHSHDQIKARLTQAVNDDRPALFDWVKHAFAQRLFQIDQNWIRNRQYLASYRRKQARFPDWLMVQVSRFADAHHARRLLGIGHVEAVHWLIPMNDGENLSRLGMVFPEDSILTDTIRNVWTTPVAGAAPFPSVQPVALANSDSYPDATIRDQDMLHLTDSVTAIFEPTNQARSVERIIVDTDALDDGSDPEVVEESQAALQVFFSPSLCLVTCL